MTLVSREEALAKRTLLGSLIGFKSEAINQSLVIPEVLIYRCYQYIARYSTESVNLVQKMVQNTDSLADVGLLDSYP